MVDYLPRTAWRARPARGVTKLVASQVKGVALHWPGMQKPLRTQEQVASALRGWQDWHMDGRGWSDIAYQVAVDQAGRAWILRGLNVRSGANGDGTVNRSHGAILLVLAPGEKPSLMMGSTVRAVVADFRKWFPAGKAVVGHRDVRAAGTDCPGPLAYAAIKAGFFTPGTVTAPPSTGGNSMANFTEADVKRIVKEAVGETNAGLYNLKQNGTAAKNHQEIEGLLRGIDGKLGALVTAVNRLADKP